MPKVNVDKMKSTLEPKVYKNIKALVSHQKAKVEYEPEEIEYTLSKVYVPDFVITFKDGRKIYIEAKGYLRPENRAQLLSVKSQYPDMDLRLVFERDNKLSKTSRTRYSDWAGKHGFMYCVGTIPEEWFE